MPYIVDSNASYNPSLNWSTFVPVEPNTLEFNPAGSSYDYSQAKQGVVIDMSALHHAYKAQFDNELLETAKEDFMLSYEGPIVSDDFRRAIERIEPGHHQFKQVQLYNYWGQPFEGTDFYLLNVVGIIKNANMNWEARRFPFELFPDQKFGHLMRFELKSVFYASDQLAEAWMELNRKGQLMEFRMISENYANH